MKHPIQQIKKDSNGTLRFRENAIVRYLLDNGGINLNQLATMSFTNDDQEQFAQLIGYSLSGFGDLSYVTDETYNAAECLSKCDKTNALQERYNHLCMELDEIKTGLKMAAVAAFKIHPEDFD